MEFNSPAGFQHVPYVSTGSLPPPEEVSQLVAEAHRRFKSNTDGVNSKVCPALQHVSTGLFGISLVQASKDTRKG